MSEESRGQAPARPTVVAVVDPMHRACLANRTAGEFGIEFAGSASDLIRAMRQPHVRALLLSVRALEEVSPVALRELRATRPGLRVAALAVPSGGTQRQLIELGTCGVEEIIDLSNDVSWQTLRGLVSDTTAALCDRVAEAIAPYLTEATRGTRGFFQALCKHAPTLQTSAVLARELQVLPSTLVSRFHRAHLPSPKRYLATTRLLYAAAYFDSGNVSIAEVSDRLGYSSPQSFGRNVKLLLGMNAGKLKAEVSFEAMAAHYAARLITPFRGRFETFDPTARGEQKMGNAGEMLISRVAEQ